MIAKPLSHFERLVNRLLSLDPDLSMKLSELSGKVISMEFINTDMLIYISPLDDRIHLSDEYEGEVNVGIRATPSDMLAYLISSRDNNSKFAGSLEIVGDVGLAQSFQGMVKELDLDWEEQVSHWLGDTAAHKLGRLARHTAKFLLESKRTLQMNMSEYLLFEKQALPVKSEISEFVQSVDELRDDVERMRLRLDKLQRRLTL